MILVLLLGAVIAGLAAALAVRALAAGRFRHRQLVAQVGLYGFEAPSATDAPGRPAVEEALSRLASWIGHRLESRIDEDRRAKIRLALNSAGIYQTSVARYLGYRALTAVGVPLAFLLLFVFTGSASTTAVVFVLVLASVGFVAPAMYVQRRAESRVQKIDHEMPELVDLLVTTVEAGVGFLAALQLASRRVREPLGQELRVALREHGMGITLDDSLRHLSDRSSSRNLGMFVQAIIQGETLGVSIGKILRDLAVDMRKRRRQMAEERAQKAPIKLLFPLVLLILPAMFVVLLGPALYSFASSVGS